MHRAEDTSDDFECVHAQYSSASSFQLEAIEISAIISRVLATSGCSASDSLALEFQGLTRGFRAPRCGVPGSSRPKRVPVAPRPCGALAGMVTVEKDHGLGSNLSASMGSPSLSMIRPSMTLARIVSRLSTAGRVSQSGHRASTFSSRNGESTLRRRDSSANGSGQVRPVRRFVRPRGSRAELSSTRASSKEPIRVQISPGSAGSRLRPPALP